jgi:hypothetical protein
VIMAILLLPHEASKDEPAEQHDISRGFSNRSDGDPRAGCSPTVFVSVPGGQARGMLL